MPSTYVAGINAVHALFSSSRRPCTLFISEDIIESALIKNIKELAIRHRVSIVSTKRGFLDTLTTARHQGIVAVLDDFKYTSLETLFSKVFMHERFEQKAAQESAISDKDDREYQKINERERQNHSALVIFLDKITDIHNFGAIIRTAVCAGVAGIVIPASGNASVNEAVFKTSVGAVSFAEICRTDNLVVAIEKFRKRGGIVYCLEATGKRHLYSLDLSGKATGFIIGSEGSGISAQVLKSSDETVYIPMNAPSSISSLNASVSAALAIYEWVRQTSFCGV